MRAKGRVSDLIVLRRPDDDTPPELGSVLEATLFGAGRPLLIVPPGGAAAFGQTIAIAWNGRTEAARAVAGALPFVDAAPVVHLLTAETWRRRRTSGSISPPISNGAASPASDGR